MTTRFQVLVLFATGNEPKVVGTFNTEEAAQAEARRYLGADARGIWIKYPDVVQPWDFKKNPF